MSKREPTIELSLTLSDLRQVYEVVDYQCRTYRGRPTRDQERTERLRMMLKAALLEVSYLTDDGAPA